LFIGGSSSLRWTAGEFPKSFGESCTSLSLGAFYQPAPKYFTSLKVDFPGSKAQEFQEEGDDSDDDNTTEISVTWKGAYIDPVFANFALSLTYQHKSETPLSGLVAVEKNLDEDTNLKLRIDNKGDCDVALGISLSENLSAVVCAGYELKDYYKKGMGPREAQSPYFGLNLDFKF